MRGYTRLVSAIDELTDHIYMLRAEQGRWGKPKPRLKPAYPQDRADNKQIAMSRGLINDILKQAHAHHTRKGGESK